MPVASDRREDAAPLAALTMRRGRTRTAKVWAATWPKLLAMVIAVGVWQAVVWSGWKNERLLPSPFTVFDAFWQDRADIWDSTVTTMGRAIRGYLLALLIGGAIGLAVARSRILRSAIGSLITGLQTMPSIAWFPAAILLFQLSERAILFVVVLGAAPSIANGMIHGVDHISPVLLRAGRVLGARGLTLVRHVVVPAALPSFVGGLKQGWAFAWRSLLAGELIVRLKKPALGEALQTNRELFEVPNMYAVMLAILVIGIIIDACFFGTAERWIRRRYGLIDAAES